MHGDANRGRSHFGLTGITYPSAGRLWTPRRTLSPHQAWIPRRRRCSLLEPVATTDDLRGSFCKSHPTSRHPPGTEQTGLGQTLGGDRLSAQGAPTGMGRISQTRRGVALRECLALTRRQWIGLASSLTLRRVETLAAPRRPLLLSPLPEYKPGASKTMATNNGWSPPGVVLAPHPLAPCLAHNKSLRTGMLRRSGL